MKKVLVIFILFTIVGHKFAYASTIGDIGDFISFKILPVYSFGATVYNSDWKTWYDYDWYGLRDLVVVNLVKSTVTDSIKDHVHEMRPNGKGNNSFPSGHTANAFANAAFIHRRYGIKQAILPYALAGAAIGFLAGWVFTNKKVQTIISADTEGASVEFRTVF